MLETLCDIAHYASRLDYKPTIDLDTTFEFLRYDDLAMVYFILDIEQQFSVSVPDEVWSQWKTVRDAHDYISTVKLT